MLVDVCPRSGRIRRIRLISDWRQSDLGHVWHDFYGSTDLGPVLENIGLQPQARHAQRSGTIVGQCRASPSLARTCHSKSLYGVTSASLGCFSSGFAPEFAMDSDERGRLRRNSPPEFGHFGRSGRCCGTSRAPFSASGFARGRRMSVPERFLTALWRTGSEAPTLAEGPRRGSLQRSCCPLSGSAWPIRVVGARAVSEHRPKLGTQSPNGCGTQGLLARRSTRLGPAATENSKPNQFWNMPGNLENHERVVFSRGNSKSLFLPTKGLAATSSSECSFWRQRLPLSCPTDP